MSNKEFFAKKLNEIKGKLPEGSFLLIVTKSRSIDEIKAYYDLGHRDFGENRVQELEEKSQIFKDSCPEIRWHMIGHLQTNKINHLYAIPHLHAIHSVHDLHLTDKLIKAQDRLSHPLNIYLQFNTSHEDEKSGFETYTELMEAADSVLKSKKLKLTGLMTMGKIRTKAFEAEARRCFQELQVERLKLQSEFKIKLETSMGMSQDYEIALEEGATWIRLGTVMFEAP